MARGAHAPVQVVGAADAEDDALRWLRGHAEDLVIVDLFLKGGSALGVLRAAGRSGPRHVVLINHATSAMRVSYKSMAAPPTPGPSTPLD